MKKYKCLICGYTYDEAEGLAAAGIAPGTKWENLPPDWACPVCGAPKDVFEEVKDSESPKVAQGSGQEIHEEVLHELSFGELSALCSNLSKGCEKQYRPEEAKLFAELSDYYKSKSPYPSENEFKDITKLINENINIDYLRAKELATDVADRGALRALTWGEKVTKILDSLLTRYEKQQDKLLINTNIYVCEICGFIYLGNDLPEICPICKVPNFKLKQIQRG